jgi:hypothetical protein
MNQYVTSASFSQLQTNLKKAVSEKRMTEEQMEGILD